MSYQTETHSYATDTDGYLTAPCGCSAHDGEDGEPLRGHPFCDEIPADLLAAEGRGEIAREYDQDQGWRWRVEDDLPAESPAGEPRRRP